MDHQDKSSTWGGSRPGAGRKPTPLRVRTFTEAERLLNQVAESLADAAATTGDKSFEMAGQMISGLAATFRREALAERARRSVAVGPSDNRADIGSGEFDSAEPSLPFGHSPASLAGSENSLPIDSEIEIRGPRDGDC